MSENQLDSSKANTQAWRVERKLPKDLFEESCAGFHASPKQEGCGKSVIFSHQASERSSMGHIGVLGP